MACKYSLIIFVLLVALAACSVKPYPSGYMLGKKTPLILEFEVNEHAQHHEKEFWIKNKGTYHISYYWVNNGTDLGTPQNLVADIEIVDNQGGQKIKTALELPDSPYYTGTDFYVFKASDIGVGIPFTLHVKDVYLKNETKPMRKGRLKIIIYRFNYIFMR